MPANKNSNMGILMKIELESLKAVEAKLKRRVAQLEKLSKLQLKVDTGQVTTGIKKVKRQVDDLGKKDLNLFNDQDKHIKKMDRELVNLSKHAKEFEFVLDKVIARYVKWGAMHLTMNALVNAMHSGMETVKELDRSLTIMNITMDGSNQMFDEMGRSAIQFAQDMNASISDVLTAMEIYSNMNETVDQILEKSQSTVILSNLTGNDISASADAIQGLMNQFDMASDSADHLVDVLVKLGANTSLEFSKSVNYMTDAVARGGEVAHSAGLSAEQYLSTIATLSEKTRMAGSSIAFGLQTMFSRLSRVGDLGAEEAFKLEKAFRDIAGVDLVDKTTGQYRDMWEILGETAQVYDTLTDAEAEYLAFQASGTRQKRYFLSLMKNFNTIQERSALAYNAQGFAMERQQIYADSLAASLTRLNSETRGLFADVVDRDYLNELVSTLADFVDTLGKINDVGGTVEKILTGIGSAFFTLSVAPMIARGLGNVVVGMQGLKGSVLDVANSFRYLSKAEKESYNTLMADNEKLAVIMKSNNMLMDQYKARHTKLNLTLDRYIEKQRTQGRLSNVTQKEIDETRREIVELDEAMKRLNSTMEKSTSQSLKTASSLNRIEQVAKMRQKISLTTSSMFALTTALSGLKYAMQDGISELESYSRGLDAISNGLLMIPTMQTMIAGSIGKIVALGIQMYDELYVDDKEIIERLSGDLDQAVKDLEDRFNIKIRVETEVDSRLYDDVFKKQKQFEGDISDVSYTEEEFALMTMLAELFPDLTKVYDENGRAVVKLTDKYKNFHDGLSKGVADASYEVNKTKLNTIVAEIEEADAMIEAQKDKIVQNRSFITNLQNHSNRGNVDAGVKQLEDGIEQSEELIEGFEKNLEELREEAKEVSLAIFSASADIDDTTMNAIKEYLDVSKDYEATSTKVADVEGWKAKKHEELRKEYEEGKELFDDYTDSITDYKSMLEELDDKNALSSDSISQIQSDYPELLEYLNDEIGLRGALEDAIDKSERIRRDSLKGSLMMSEEYFKKQTSAYKDHFENVLEFYDHDAEQYTNLMEAKLDVTETVLNRLNEAFGKAYSSERDYRVDVANLFGQDPSKAIKLVETYNEQMKPFKEMFEKIDIDTNLDDIFNGIGKFDGDTSSVSGYAKALGSIVDLYKEYNRQLDYNQKSLNYIENILGILPEHDLNRVTWLNKENKALVERNSIYDDMMKKAREVMAQNKEILVQNGVSFEGDYLNYKSYMDAVDTLNTKMNAGGVSKDAKKSLSNQFNSIKESFNAYIDAQDNKLKDSQEQWMNNLMAIKENDIAMDGLSLTNYQKGLEDIENAFEVLGEVNTLEEYKFQTELYRNQQKLLNGTLAETERLLTQYKGELASVNEETTEGQLEAAMLRARILELDDMKASVKVSMVDSIQAEQDHMFSIIQDVEEQLLSAVEKRIERETELEDELHNERLERLNKEKEEIQDKYDAEIKALRTLKAEQDYQSSVDELRSDKAEVEKQLQDISRDDSMSAVAREKELREELAEIEKKLNEEISDHALEKAEEEIEAKKQAESDAFDRRIAKENEEYESYKENLERRKEQDELYAETQRLLATKTIDEIGQILVTHQNNWESGMSLVGDTIQGDVLSKLHEATAIMEKFGFDEFNTQIGQEITAQSQVNLDAHMPSLENVVEERFEISDQLTEDAMKEIKRSLDDIVEKSVDADISIEFADHATSVQSYLAKIVKKLDDVGASVTINNDWNINGELSQQTQQGVSNINDSMLKRLRKNGTFKKVNG